MADPPSSELPPKVAKILERFRMLPREEKMDALLLYSRKLEPLPERFAGLDRSKFGVPECMTPVAIFPELKEGRVHFYADVNVRQSPTIAAFLAILFGAVNNEPPETLRMLPDDFARQVMDSIGLGAREAGLNAIVQRVKRQADAGEEGS